MKSAPWRIRKQGFHQWNSAVGTYMVMWHYKRTQEFQKFGRNTSSITSDDRSKSGFQNIAEDSECSTQALLAFHSERNLGDVSDKSHVMPKNQSKPVRRKANVGLLAPSLALATTKAHRLGATNGMAEQFATCFGLPGAAESPQIRLWKVSQADDIPPWVESLQNLNGWYSTSCNHS